LLRNQPEWATHTPWQDYWQEIDLFTPRYNIAPSQECPVVIFENEQPQLVSMRWGFRPSWAKASFAKINSRSETLFDSKMFAHAARRTRCLVPADGFYEPKGPATHHARPWQLFEFEDRRVFMMAGIFTRFSSANENYWNFSIVTTQANSFIAPVHSRMPVILEPDHWNHWLTQSDESKLKTLLSSRDYPSLITYPVGEQAKNPRNEGPACAEPLTDPNLPLF
jgi:putative SOS response-associated peptidase YedK